MTVFRRAAIVAIHACALSLVFSAPASGQFPKRMAQLTFCAGGGVVGMKLGDRLTNVAQQHAAKFEMTPAEMAQYRRKIQIGTAAILCLSGSALAGSAYENLSKRDLEARKKEIELAVREADPLTREYVMPESGRKARITTDAIYKDGDRECKRAIDQLIDVGAGEQAIVTYCRKPGGQFDLQY